MKKSCFKLFITLSLLLSAPLLWGQSNKSPIDYQNPGKMPSSTAETAKKRPTVALILSGGGINGSAEIPVLEKLEELHIPVDFIAGTSIGAIVGGLYSCGYTTKEIYNLLFTQDWPSIFNDYVLSPYERIYREHGLEQNFIPLDFSLSSGLNMGMGISNGQNALQMLKNLTVKFPSDIDFDSLPVPFRAVATDMITGEPYLFHKGDLSQAIRASMTVAGLFEPLYIDGHYLLDGGLSYNLPIEIARKMGYDIIIAVDIPPSSKKSIATYRSSPLYTLQDSIYTPMKTTSNLFLSDADLVLTPDLSSFEITDFNKAKDIYQKGKEEVELHQKDFEEIAKLFDHSSGEKRRSLYRNKGYLKADSITIQGAYEEDLSYIEKNFLKIKGKELTEKVINSFIHEIYKTGHYDLVQSKILQSEDGYSLNLLLRAKNKPSIQLIANMELSQTFCTAGTSSFFSTDFNLNFKDFNLPDSLLSIRGSALNDWSLSFLYFQPFNRHLYASLLVDYTRQNYKLYDSYTFVQDKISFGMNNYNHFFMEGGAFINFNKVPLFEDQTSLKKEWDWGFFTETNLNFLDQPAFSERGFLFKSQAKVIIPLKENKSLWNDFSLPVSLKVKAAFPLSQKFFLNLSLFAGYNFYSPLQNGLIELEGFNNYDRLYFPHNCSKNEFSNHEFAASASLLFLPSRALTIFGGKLYISAGASYASLKTFKEGEWTVNTGAGLRLVESTSLMARFGIAVKENEALPFFTIDFGYLEL